MIVNHIATVVLSVKKGNATITNVLGSMCDVISRMRSPVGDVLFGTETRQPIRCRVILIGTTRVARAKVKDDSPDTVADR